MNSLFRILLIIGIIGLSVVVVMFLIAGFRVNQSAEPTTPNYDQVGGGDGQQGTTFVPPAPQDVDIISIDFETVLEVDVTREVSFSNLDELVRNPSPVFPTITSEYWTDTKGYIIMTCEYEGKTDKALMMTARYITEPATLEDSFAPARDALDDWGPYILRDVGTLVFPTVRGVEGSTPSPFMRVSNSDIKQASFDVNGEEFDIFSGWVLNYLFLSSSALCLEAAKTEIYAPHTH